MDENHYLIIETLKLVLKNQRAIMMAIEFLPMHWLQIDHGTIKSLAKELNNCQLETITKLSELEEL